MPPPVEIKAHDAVNKFYWVNLGAQRDHGAAKFTGQSEISVTITQLYTNLDNDLGFDITFFLEGTNIDYQKIGGQKVPVSGTIRDITISVDDGGGDDVKLAISGLKLGVAEIGQWWLDDRDIFKALERILQGRTYIEGSDEDDELLFGGTGNDKINGMGGSDHVNGGKGDDVNDGGLGLDFLDDTKGHDTFRFTTAFDLTNYDAIKKFSGGDKISLAFDLVGAQIGEKLNASEFVIGDAALDGNDHIIWDDEEDRCYWDPDGSGILAPIPIFTTGNDAKISHKIFYVYDDG
jgi:Ca2+-binding RTX toxin-like protein